MATIKVYGFIVKGPGYRRERDRAVLDSGAFATTVVGVENVDGACAAATTMVSAGIEVIELCGGFSHDEEETVIEAIGGRVPVGRVRFMEKEERKLAARPDGSPA